MYKKFVDLITKIYKSNFIYNYYEDLDFKKKTLFKLFIKLALLLIFLSVLFHQVYTVNSVQDDIYDLQKNYNQILNYANKVTQLRSAISNFEKEDLDKSEEFSMLSFLEKNAKDAGISKDKIDSITESTLNTDKKRNTMEIQAVVKFDNITLEQLKNFLYSIENSVYKLNIPSLKIRSFYINPNLIKVEMSVMFLKFIKNGNKL